MKPLASLDKMPITVCSARWSARKRIGRAAGERQRPDAAEQGETMWDVCRNDERSDEASRSFVRSVGYARQGLALLLVSSFITE